VTFVRLVVNGFSPKVRSIRILELFREKTIRNNSLFRRE
jgi:hypothetical protein